MVPDLGQSVPGVAAPSRLGRAPRRRPSGAPQPLPRDLRRTGVGWLIGAVVAVVLTVLIFRNGVSGAAINILVVDDTVVRWISGVDLPGVPGIAQVVSYAASSGIHENTKSPVDVEAACDAMEPMWLQAQAVQTAELVPCVASLPVGWSFGELTVNNGRSTISVNHDRAGSKAIDLRFAGSCAPQVQPRSPTTFPEAAGSSAHRSTERTPSSRGTRCSQAGVRRCDSARATPPARSYRT